MYKNETNRAAKQLNNFSLMNVLPLKKLFEFQYTYMLSRSQYSVVFISDIEGNRRKKHAIQ